jgi:septum formation protein
VIVLASASPRRAELLRAAGIPFDVVAANIDETVHPGEAPDDYARRVAAAKARGVAAQAGGRPVLAADTVVVVDRHILGKPVDDDDARRMLRLLSGRAHDVVTAVVLDEEAAVERTRVEFATLDDDEIRRYVASGEPRDKAGAYAIQGLASRFVTRIDGSYSNVVGLPVSRVYQLLRSRALI